MAPPKDGEKKHVVIVGAGAAGMSCAATLAQHPDKFKVTVLEKGSVCGGQATSIPLDENKFGAGWMNNGVQGGSPVSIPCFVCYKGPLEGALMVMVNWLGWRADIGDRSSSIPSISSTSTSTIPRRSSCRSLSARASPVSGPTSSLASWSSSTHQTSRSSASS